MDCAGEALFGYGDDILLRWIDDEVRTKQKDGEGEKERTEF